MLMRASRGDWCEGINHMSMGAAIPGGHKHNTIAWPPFMMPLHGTLFGMGLLLSTARCFHEMSPPCRTNWLGPGPDDLHSDWSILGGEKNTICAIYPSVLSLDMVNYRPAIVKHSLMRIVPTVLLYQDSTRDKGKNIPSGDAHALI